MTGLYLIKKNGKFTKDFEEGAKLTINIDLAERFTNKKAANEAARKYGKMYGKGYSVVAIYEK